MDIDPRDNAIYVASVPESGEVDLNNSMFGIYKSDDSGKTWKLLRDDELIRISLKIKDLTIDPYHKGRIYLSTMGNGVIVGEPAHLSRI